MNSVPIADSVRPLDRVVAKDRPVRRLISNGLAMAAANIAGRGLGYISILLLARHLPTANLGIYGLLITALMLMELVSNLGLDKILIREIASGLSGIQERYFWAAMLIRLGMAALTLVSAVVLLQVFFRQSIDLDVWTVAICLSAIFPIVATRNCEALLTAQERLFPIALSQVCERIVAFGAVLLLLYGQISFAGLLRFTPLAAAVRLLIIAIAVRQSWMPGESTYSPRLRTLLRQGLELFSVEVLALVYFRSDTFFIARMRGMGSAGIYQVAYKVFDFCLSLFSGFLQATFPRLVRDGNRSLSMVLQIGVVVLLLPVAAVIVLRNPLLRMFNPAYTQGAWSLVWLMLTVPLVYVTSTVANAAIAAGRVRILIVLAFLLIGSNVTMNLLLIPRWGISGAAFATFACELFSACLLVPFLFSTLGNGRTR